MKTFTIDEAHRMVLVRYSGAVTDEDVNLGLADYGRLAPEYAFLVDFRETTVFSVSTPALRRLGHVWSERLRCAVIASTDLAFGLARMVQLYANNPGVGVFRCEQDERAWLTRDSTDARP